MCSDPLDPGGEVRGCSVGGTIAMSGILPLVFIAAGRTIDREFTELKKCILMGGCCGCGEILHFFRLFWGNCQRGVYPLIFWSNVGIGQTRPREAPARAPDCPKFSSDALARCL